MDTKIFNIAIQDFSVRSGPPCGRPNRSAVAERSGLEASVHTMTTLVVKDVAGGGDGHVTPDVEEDFEFYDHEVGGITTGSSVALSVMAAVHPELYPTGSLEGVLERTACGSGVPVILDVQEVPVLVGELTRDEARDSSPVEAKHFVETPLKEHCLVMPRGGPFDEVQQIVPSGHAI